MGAQSKGCGTCKRRKLKCDETHPKCTRCRSAGIECTGFTPRLRFVDENPRIQRHAAVSRKQTHEFSTVTRSSQLAFHSSLVRKDQLGSPASFLAAPLSLIAFKHDIFISYLVFKFFGGESQRPSAVAGGSPCGLPREWIPELIKTSQKPRPKSWDALATIVYGQAHNSHDVITDALSQYGQALLELRSQLFNPNHRHTNSALASITALYIYEILVSKTQKGWMLHADGLGGLLQLRGPWLQKSYTRKSIFFEHRITLVAKAIISRQSTFLHSKIWKTVPWEDDPTSKSAMDYLVDIGADIAEYLALLKTYNSRKTNHQGLEYTQLKTQVAISLKELNAWWYKWGAESAKLVTEIPSHHQEPTSGKRLFPTFLEYDTLSTAYEICMYDSMRILLLQLYHLIPNSNSDSNPNSTSTSTSTPNPSTSSSSSSPDDDDDNNNKVITLDEPNPTSLLGITTNTKGLAHEILRSLNYSYRKSRRFTNTVGFLFIQEVAYGYFNPDSQEAKWVYSHGWAEFIGSDAKRNENDVEKNDDDDDDVQDRNLLKRFLPCGVIKLD